MKVRNQAPCCPYLNGTALMQLTALRVATAAEPFKSDTYHSQRRSSIRSRAAHDKIKLSLVKEYMGINIAKK